MTILSGVQYITSGRLRISDGNIIYAIYCVHMAGEYNGFCGYRLCSHQIHQYLNEKAMRKSRSKILMHMIHMQMQNNFIGEYKIQH